MEVADTDPGKRRICTACIDDAFYKERIEHDGITGRCDFDDSHGSNNKTVTIVEMAEIVDEIFRENYGPGGDVPEISADSDNVFYSQAGSPYKEIMQEELQCSDEIIEVISDYLPDASNREIQKGAEYFYDETSNYVALNAEGSEPHDYDPDDPSSGSSSVVLRSPEETYADLQSRVAELRRELSALRSRPAGIGHNHPPEPIGSFDSLDGDLTELEGALQILEAQPVKPPETAMPAIETATLKIESIDRKWRSRLTKLGGDILSGVAKEAGRRLLDGVIDDGWLKWATIHLEAIVSLARDWLHANFPPF